MPSLHDSYPEIRKAFACSITEAGGSFGDLVVALLTRSFSEPKARELFNALVAAGLDSPEELATADLSELAEATRSVRAPQPPVSAKVMKPLQLLSRWIVNNGGVEALEDSSTDDLREQLRAISGVGQSAADAILLFGLRRPTYPVDSATYRILARHAWLDPSASYEDARSTMDSLEPDQAGRLADLAINFAEIGARYCRTSAPRCEHCPLSPFLPESGPCQPEFE